jgi:hypothetical protein
MSSSSHVVCTVAPAIGQWIDSVERDGRTQQTALVRATLGLSAAACRTIRLSQALSLCYTILGYCHPLTRRTDSAKGAVSLPCIPTSYRVLRRSLDSSRDLHRVIHPEKSRH